MVRAFRLPTTERGYTLIEIVIAMLLTAVMVTSVFSVSLTAKAGLVRNERRLLCNQAVRHLSNQLRNFIRPSSYASTEIVGPGNAALSTNGWGLTGTPGPLGTGASGVVDNCTATGTTTCWALNAGTHTLTQFLPPLTNGASFEGSPYNARVTYFVSGTPPIAQVTCTWNEP